MRSDATIQNVYRYTNELPGTFIFTYLCGWDILYQLARNSKKQECNKLFWRPNGLDTEHYMPFPQCLILVLLKVITDNLLKKNGTFILDATFFLPETVELLKKSFIYKIFDNNDNFILDIFQPHPFDKRDKTIAKLIFTNSINIQDIQTLFDVYSKRAEENSKRAEENSKRAEENNKTT